MLEALKGTYKSSSAVVKLVAGLEHMVDFILFVVTQLHVCRSLIGFIRSFLCFRSPFINYLFLFLDTFLRIPTATRPVTVK